MPQNPSDDKSTLVQVMAWCRQAPSHYLSQCCPRSLSPYGVTRPQWVNVCIHPYWCTMVNCDHGSHAVLISGKSAYFETWASRPWKSPYFWIFSIEVREKSLFSIAVSKPGWSTSSCASWGFSKCCGNDVELFGNPSDPSTNHRWRVVWRHLVPATIPRASFIKFYYVVTESQSADIWCHVVAVRNLIGPQSRRYTWRTLCKTSSIFVEIRQHT